MAQLSLDQKREITQRLGYRLVDQEGSDKRDLYGPDGRHKAIFRPSKAADLWIWNDAVFNFALYQDRQGGVHRLVRSARQQSLLERLWPEKGEQQEVPDDALAADYERLGGSLTS